jgi:hypothetical protein
MTWRKPMNEQKKIEELTRRVEELEAKVGKLLAAVFPKPDLSRFKEKGGK